MVNIWMNLPGDFLIMFQTSVVLSVLLLPSMPGHSPFRNEASYRDREDKAAGCRKRVFLSTSKNISYFSFISIDECHMPG